VAVLTSSYCCAGRFQRLFTEVFEERFAVCAQQEVHVRCDGAPSTEYSTGGQQQGAGGTAAGPVGHCQPDRPIPTAGKGNKIDLFGY